MIKVLLVIDIIWLSIASFVIYMETSDVWQLVVSVLALVLQLLYLSKNSAKQKKNVAESNNNVE